ncbi:hypothetical protein [Brevifollis gellanilyticus]|uniref:Uncharacterized protein n=1 Tax=Brevifollis gellanilyticus TaxID=748831 RepID=A0A512MBU0_9BACT|nr:hypothetical protein [Brevifollis gellanilyticus]GEP44202.1 hypothetical protein BGE01nite_34930 [Brevifollis gellanilyticus]
MKTELASFTLNSSTAFQAAPSKLGWEAMPVFNAPVQEREITFGWDAMPAFGEALEIAPRAAVMAGFIPETQPVSRKSGLLSSFWSAVSRVAHA